MIINDIAGVGLECLQKDSNSWMHENVHCWEKNSGLAYVATKAIRWHSTVATAYSWRFIMQLISKFSH